MIQWCGCKPTVLDLPSPGPAPQSEIQGPHCQDQSLQSVLASGHRIKGPCGIKGAKPAVAIGFMTFLVQNHCQNLFIFYDFSQFQLALSLQVFMNGPLNG